MNLQFSGPSRQLLERPTVLAALALFVLFAVLLHESLFGGKGLLPANAILAVPPWNGGWEPGHSNYLLADQFAFLQPVRQFMYDRLLEGDFALWNPHIACGLPTIASMQGAVFYPINLLLMPLEPFTASGIAAFLKLLLGGVFTLLYMRRLGVGAAPALISAIVFPLSGFMTVWLGHPHVNVAVLLPALLYLLECQLDPAEARAGRWALVALVLGAMMLGGHPPTLILCCIMAGAYYLFRLAEPGRTGRVRSIAAFAAALAGGLLLSSIQLLPFLEYIGQSSMTQSSATLTRWSNHLEPRELTAFVLPFLAGSPFAGNEYMGAALGIDYPNNFNERSGYVGVLSLFLATASLLLRRSRTSVFYMVASGVLLLIALGTPPWPQVFQALPLLDGVRPNRVLLLIGWCAAVLAGFGLDGLLRAAPEQRARRVAPCFLLLVAVAAALSWMLLGVRLAEFPFPFRQHVIAQFGWAAGGMLIAMVAVTPRASPRLIAALCVGWTMLDMHWFASRYNPSIPRSEYYPSTPAIEFLTSQTQQKFRFHGLQAELPPNTASLYGIDDIRGRDFMSIRRYEELITGNAGDFEFFFSMPQLPSTFGLLNVEYVLAARRIDDPPPDFELVYERELAIYRYKAALPRALVVFEHEVMRDPRALLERVRGGDFDPATTVLLESEPQPPPAGASTARAASVRIVEYAPDRVAVETHMPRAGFLVLFDNWFPGWTATVDGRTSTVHRANYAFRAVAVPAGSARVEFRYEPWSFRIGLWISVLSVALLLGAPLLVRRYSARGAATARPNTAPSLPA